MTAADVRIPRAALIVAGTSVVVAVAILWLARGYTFYFDEWDFILTAPGWTLATYLQPHNEHPSMLLRVIYSGLLATVGLRSYVPYMAALLALHVTSVVLLFRLVRRRAGDLIGLACAALLLVLGAGWEDLLWAFQVAWLGSVACGLGMMLALEAPRTRRRLLLAAALLAASLMFSGIGLPFGVAAAVQLGATAGRRRDLLWLVPVAVALGVWYLAYGHGGTPPNPPPSAANIMLLPLYAAWGLGASVAGLIGESGLVGLLMLVLAAIAVGLGWRRHGWDPFAIGVAAGLLSFYVITGLTRAQLGYQQSGAGRYVYIGAVFWLLLLSGAARNLRWRGTWRPALVACVFLAAFNSGVLLVTYAAAKTAQMQRQAADLRALDAVRNNPCLNPQASVDSLVMPQLRDVRLYYRAIDLYGDPAFGAAVDSADFERATRSLLSGRCS